MSAGHDHDLAEHAHHEADDEHNRSGERRTRWVVALTAVMMVGELIVGHMTDSLALTADGWHMGTHVLALGLAVGAYWYARRHAGNDKFSFGTGKVYALAGYTSGLVLLGVAVWMAKEGAERLFDHPDVNFGEALPIAAAGLLVNLVSAGLLGGHHHYGHDHGGHDHGGHDHDDHDHDDHDHDDHDGHDHHDHGHDHAHDAPSKPEGGTLDFNLRAAYIHIMADAITSVLAIAALTLGRFTTIWWMDPIMGFVGGGVITWWSVSLCRQASRQLLDVVSSARHESKVRERLEQIDDVRVADLHVWELGPGRRSCIVSIVTAHPRELAVYREAVLGTMTFAHLTIEIHRCELGHSTASTPQVAHQHAH
nr:CDF family Co(II)/Ni(II) efflux transporter DmeF [Kofleriaceae bacterium]